MRVIHKSWDNRKELRGPNGRYNSWNRRVKWYEGANDIRLSFEDEDGKTSCIYTSEADADIDFEKFKNKQLSVLELI